MAFMLLMAAAPASVAAASDTTVDPLPSWNDTAPKEAIMTYVAKVTTPGAETFVPLEDRIAVFDNDGTLWPENPVPFQLSFALDTLVAMAKDKPELKDDPMVQAALAGDVDKLMAGPHHEGLLHIIALTHAGMTTQQFRESVEHWLHTAQHPRFKRPYDQLAYVPMLELLAYLRANGFKTFIVSGGGADFMRVWSEKVYGIPPDQVVGSMALTKFEMQDGAPVLIKTMDHLFVDDKAGKPVGIHAFIGQRPVAAFGNSDGDKEMLEYATIKNPLPGFGLLVHHTDAEREYAYDAHPKSSGKLVAALAEAPERGWIVVDMKNDWNRIFTANPQ